LYNVLGGGKMEARSIEKEVLTPKEASEYLKVNLRTIYRKVKKGEIPCMKLGSKLIRIKKEDLDRLFVKEKN
jgi:excisionase family DNA binding protein